MITLNKVSHSSNIILLIWWYLCYTFSLYWFGKVWGIIFGPHFLKPWNSLENICVLLKGSCLFSLTLEECGVSEETMRKHHIQLRCKHDPKLYSKTEDNIEFMCQCGYCPVSPDHTFWTTCREGKMVYPTCGWNIDKMQL